MDGKVIVYEDDLGLLPDNQISYSASLAQIAPGFKELNNETMDDMETYTDNIRLELDFILGYFQGIHDTHDAALRVYEMCRTAGRQYCVYLRSFSWAGMSTSTGETLVLSPGDGEFKKLLKESLPSDIAAISFVNTFDLDSAYGGAESVASRRLAAIPSLRVLSHNWQEIVREVIRGARLVILYADGATKGLAYEAGLVSECGMEKRTIVIGSEVSSSEVFSNGGFASLIDREDVLRLCPWTDVEASELAEAAHALSTDNFTRCNDLRDLSGFSCWLVDRQIALARASYTVDELAGVPYDHYVPSSLINNWNILEIMYPRMNEQWDLIVVDSQHERRTPRGRIYEALNAAVHTFLVAATIERYYHMAVALSTIGMAHRKLTGELSFMTNCYAHATRCAQWSGDSELTAFLAHAYSELEQEASKTTAPDHVDQ